MRTIHLSVFISRNEGKEDIPVNYHKGERFIQRSFNIFANTSEIIS